MFSCYFPLENHHPSAINAVLSLPPPAEMIELRELRSFRRPLFPDVDIDTVYNNSFGDSRLHDLHPLVNHFSRFHPYVWLQDRHTFLANERFDHFPSLNYRKCPN